MHQETSEGIIKCKKPAKKEFKALSMKYDSIISIVLNILSFLSFVFFFVTTDHFVAPLGLMFLLSIPYQLTFVGVTFGLSIVLFLIGTFANNKLQKVKIRLLYVIISVSCISGLLIGDLSMLSELPSIFSLVIFLVIFSILAYRLTKKITEEGNKKVNY